MSTAFLIGVLLAGAISPQEAESCKTAAARAYAAMFGPTPPVPPVPPGPKTQVTCPSCRGKGKLGDGTVFVKCPTCNGTGKVDAEKSDSDESDSPANGGGEGGSEAGIHAAGSAAGFRRRLLHRGG